MLVYKKPDYLEITYNSQKNYLLFEWFNATIPQEEHKASHTKAFFEVAKEKGVACVIADCSKMKYSFSREVTDWFANEMMPKLSQIGIKRIITILNDSSMSKLNADSWQRANNIDLPNVGNFAEAEKFLDLSIQLEIG
ncbi:MAG: hypothetical protein AAF551_12885 [Bacteroidota bacterium]